MFVLQARFSSSLIFLFVFWSIRKGFRGLLTVEEPPVGICSSRSYFSLWSFQLNTNRSNEDNAESYLLFGIEKRSNEAMSSNVTPPLRAFAIVLFIRSRRLRYARKLCLFLRNTRPMKQVAACVTIINVLWNYSWIRNSECVSPLLLAVDIGR